MTNNVHDAVGPIDFVLLEFPDREPTGTAAAALGDLVDNGTIRLYDILAIRKGADGSVSGFEIGGLDGDGSLGFAAFAGARSGLIGDDEVTDAAAAMEAGTIAVLLVYENAWAGPFVAAVHGAGGHLAASARIPVQTITDALDALEEEE